MEIINTIEMMQRVSNRHRAAGETVGFVPTMGYLHEGHLTLVRRSRAACGVTVASIFVNPLQFGPAEDLAKYPRDLPRDSALLAGEGTDYLFLPTADEMYPAGFQTFVEVTEVTKTLCGASRPGHFRGVATVVAKLFNAVMPDKAFFGEKDYQQLAAIRRMVKDLNMAVDIVGVPIVREPDGLAMSSRNTYLSPEQRRSALCLSQALARAASLAAAGERDAGNILAAVRETIASASGIRIDYVRLCDPDTLEYIEEGPLSGNTLIAVAAFLGATRLIDNRILEVGS